MDCSPLSSSVHGNFLRHEYQNALPFSPPGDLPDPGIEPTSPVALVLQADSLPLSHLSSFFFAYFPTCDLKSIKNFSLAGKEKRSLKCGLVSCMVLFTFGLLLKLSD